MKKIIEEQTKELRGAGFFDFGRAAYGTLELELEARCGEHVEAVIGECAENGSILHRHGWTTFMLDRFALKPGRRTYRFHIPPHLPAYGGQKHPAVPAECGGEIAPFRYAELNHYYGTATLRRTVWFDDWEEGASEFRSSDPDLDKLWEFCKYSIKVTSIFGVYIDGERERLPYEADSYINQLGHFCCDANYRTAKNTIDFFEECPTWPTEWRLLTPVLVRDFFLYSGDRASVDRWLKWLPARLLPETAGGDGLLRNGAKLGIPGLRDIIDWPEHDRDGYELAECNFVPNAYYHGALAAMYELTGEENYRRRAAALRKTLREKFFREGRPADSLGSSHTSLHSAVFALRFGIAEKAEIPHLAEFIRSKGMACSVYGAQFLLEACAPAGLDDHFYALLTSKGERSWLNMLAQGSTITMESWGEEDKPFQDWTHAWGAAPANLIPRQLAGIRPLAPGFSKFTVAPLRSAPEQFYLRAPTIRGPVELEFSGKSGKLVVPENTQALWRNEWLAAGTHTLQR